MSISISERINRLRGLRQRVNQNRNRNAAKMTADMLALLKKRVQSQGENSEGQQFADYSTPYAKKRSKSTNDGGFGKQVAYVDFDVTGRMWNSIQPIVTNEGSDNIQIIIRATDSENQQKLNGQFQKRGNILKPSEREIALLQRLNKERILKEVSKL